MKVRKVISTVIIGPDMKGLELGPGMKRLVLLL